MSGSTIDAEVPESGLSSKIESLSVESNGEQQPLPTSPGSLSEIKEGGKQEELLAAAERSLLQKVIRKGLIENKNDLEIQRKDPKSPLYSVKSFEALNLRPQLLKGVYSMGEFYHFLTRQRKGSLKFLIMSLQKSMFTVIISKFFRI